MGGIVTFGPLGFIYGPVILAITVTIISIYQIDYADAIYKVNRK